MEDLLEKEIVKTELKINLDIQPPKFYNVVYLDDNVTPMTFVVETLIEVFDKTENEATDLMMQVHEKGYAVIATLTHELAEQKKFEVDVMSKRNGYSLKVELRESN